MPLKTRGASGIDFPASTFWTWVPLSLPRNVTPVVLKSQSLLSAILTEQTLNRAYSRDPASIHQCLDAHHRLGRCYTSIREDITNGPDLGTILAIFYLLKSALLFEHSVDVVLGHLLGLETVLRIVNEKTAAFGGTSLVWLLFQGSAERVLDYMLDRPQEFSKVAERKLFELHHSLQYWSTNIPYVPGDHMTLCAIYSLAHHAVKRNFRMRSSLGTEMFADLIAHARHEYIQSSSFPSELLTDISTLSQVNLNMRIESHRLPRLHTIYKCSRYFETILIESTLRTMGDDQAKSNAVSSATLLALIAANNRQGLRTADRSLFLAGLVLTKSRFPQGTCSHLCSHLLEHSFIHKEWSELGRRQSLGFYSFLPEYHIVMPRFWDLADQCSSLQEIWDISCSGFTAAQLYLKIFRL